MPTTKKTQPKVVDPVLQLPFPAWPALDDSPVDFAELVARTGEAWLAALTQSQQAFLKAAADATPHYPASSAADLSTWGAASRELAEASFAFVDKYLANQKSYTQELLALSGV
ncbi:MAG: hypothetical protein KDB63_08745 [Nocardioidaceae bacterium]|jgi:hypothetical protein|nr:hypothetical protein [Nocardioidaceae bacterium]